MSRRQRVNGPVQGLAAAAIFGLALTLAGPASAQNVAAAPPEDPVAKAAFEVLEKHCARCHQEGALTARERPSKNFGNVLKLEEIASNPHYILPGNPFGSKLFKQIVDKEMPYDVEYEGETKYPSVTPDELKALEAWITQLGTKSAAACDTRKFVSNEDMLNLVVGDLSKLPNARKKGTRYLTLTHLKNACMDEQAMKVYRQGAVKLINSLSRSSDVVRLETIDPDESIIRINLDDIGWDAKDWDEVLAVYPYNMQPESDLKAVLTSAAGTQLPYVRADWFAFTASQPPLYDKLLKLPNTFPEVAKQEGVDIEGNIKRFIAQRSGFQRSGVSQNNRLIERHPSRAGYFWTSYDFSGNRGKQSFFEHPLGPKGPDAFEHDGGESIWSLPNGFQAYYLNTADGKKLDKGPTQIVRDLSRKDLTVTNGISCMGCHDQGIRKAKDEVRQVVLSGKSFNKQTRDAVEALYIPSEKMDAILEADTKKFQDAMFRAGLEPSLKLNGVEMINALAKRYEDDLDLTLAAAEFGFNKKDFEDAADDADRKFRPLIRRLQQGSIPRDQFENNYRELATAITDQEAVPGTGGNAPSSGGAAFAVATPVSNEALSLTSDKNAYEVGDTPVFTVLAKKTCFLTLVNLDDKGTATVLLPNKFQQDNKVKAGQEIRFPGQKAPFQFRMQDKGFEQVIATCSESADVDGIKNDFARNTLTRVPNFTRTVAGAVQADAKKRETRAIAIEGTKAAGAPTTPQNAKAVPADRRDVFRAAIKVEVK
jgi:mono/diheme cytochrome c family protein